MLNLEKAYEYEKKGLLTVSYRCGKYYANCKCGLGWDSIDKALKCCSEYGRPEEEVPPDPLKLTQNVETLNYVNMPFTEKVALVVKSESNAKKWRQLYGFKEEDIVIVTENNLDSVWEYPIVFVGHVSRIEKLPILRDPRLKEEFEKQKSHSIKPTFELKHDKEGYFLEETSNGEFSNHVFRNGKHIYYSKDSELF